AAVNSAISEAANQMLHQEDYAGMNAILDRASRMQLNELVIKKGDFNLSIRSGNGSSSGHAFSEPFVESAHPEIHDEVREKEVALKSVEKENQEYKDTINAVMAGTFYRSAGADQPAFVEEGTEVKEGDPICILEAMKLFNEIEAPFDCKILKILVDDATLMKKDQPIMAIKKL
ncbi:MAG: hypothetical protein PF485_13245, partial [Bacteroidales bacterium]|nr:hypothetical protein [Bacteroidales bacterium]